MKYITLIILFSFTFGCQKGDWDSEGKMITNEGYFFKAMEFPVGVITHQEHMVTRTIDSINWWDDQLYNHWLTYCAADIKADCEWFPNLIEYDSYNSRVVVMEVEELDSAGVASITTDRYGFIRKSTIRINKKNPNHIVMDHELGHGLFGLAHDNSPEYGMTADHNESVMVPFMKSVLKYDVMYGDAVLIFKDYLKLKTIGRTE